MEGPRSTFLGRERIIFPTFRQWLGLPNECSPAKDTRKRQPQDGGDCNCRDPDNNPRPRRHTRPSDLLGNYSRRWFFLLSQEGDPPYGRGCARSRWNSRRGSCIALLRGQGLREWIIHYLHIDWGRIEEYLAQGG